MNKLKQIINDSVEEAVDETLNECGLGYKSLDEYSTSALVSELAKRDGVKKEIAEPYESKKINVEGPAIVLVVID